MASSIQFTLDMDRSRIERFLAECTARGSYIKWFGTAVPVAFTSNDEHWKYMKEEPYIPNSKAVLDRLFDLRTPLSLTDDDCALIGRIVVAACALAAAA